MTGQAENVDVHPLHMDGEHAAGLGGIHHKGQPMLRAEPAQHRQLVQISRHIGTVGAHQRPGIRPHRTGERRPVHPAPGVCREDRERYPLLRQQI